MSGNINRKAYLAFALAAPLAWAAPVGGQQQAGADSSRIAAGTYRVDPSHTQVIWSLDHLGITPLSGAFGASDGSLTIDPAVPTAAEVSVTFNVADVSTTSAAFTKHLLAPDMFDASRFATATFKSTSVTVEGTKAQITGDLTIKGITKPVTLAAKLYGVGNSPFTKKLNIGFSATASIKRSDFGLGYGVPHVADDVHLQIAAAFEHAG